MTKRNNRAKREARQYAADTGLKYTRARRATARPSSSPHPDPVVRTVYAWVDGTLIDSSLDAHGAARGDYVLDVAETARARTSSLSAVRELIDEHGYGSTFSKTHIEEADARYVIEMAEIENAYISGLSVERDLIEEYEDGLRLVAATFEVDITMRGFIADVEQATDIVNRGVGRLVEEVTGGAHIVLRPRTAQVQLTVRVEESDSLGEVLQVDSFIWLS